MASLFINYRYSDESGTARWLATVLATRFGLGQIFLDNESIQLGTKYQQEIPRRLYQATAVLAIIGPRWLDAPDASGGRALDSPRDWVRREIATAIARGIPVIPVLVHGTQVPPAADLPADLRHLVHYQGISIDPHSGPQDIEGLVDRLCQRFPELVPIDTARATPVSRDTQRIGDITGQSVGHNRIGGDSRIRIKGDSKINIRVGTAWLWILGVALLSGGTAAVVVIHPWEPSVQLKSIVGKWEDGGADMGAFASAGPGILTVSADGHFTFTQSFTELPGFLSPQAATGGKQVSGGLGVNVDCVGSVEPKGDHFAFHSTSGTCTDFNVTLAENNTIVELQWSAGTESLARAH